MAWDDGLEEPALSIAATNRSPVRVLAGPGTGKSFAMKRRVARLLEDGVSPIRILVVTFTRMAASDLVGELKAMGVPGCDELNVGTLHAYCFRLLTRDAVFAFNQRIPRPLQTYRTSGILRFEAQPMLADLRAKTFGADREKTRRVLAFEAAWSRLQDQEPGWPEDGVDREFQEALQAWLRFHRAMLVGELTPEALRYLRNNPQADALQAFDHVLVDEYQDLNRAEQELIDQLAASGMLTIVGDEDQSIYSFRHANPEGITDFGNTHPGTYDATLGLCRRCPTNVVAIADSLIRHNHPGERDARLEPMPENGAGNIAVVQWSNLDEELEGMAR